MQLVLFDEAMQHLMKINRAWDRFDRVRTGRLRCPGEKRGGTGFAALGGS